MNYFKIDIICISRGFFVYFKYVFSLFIRCFVVFLNFLIEMINVFFLLILLFEFSFNIRIFDFKYYNFRIVFIFLF